jgi:hypothetical protein
MGSGQEWFGRERELRIQAAAKSAEDAKERAWLAYLNEHLEEILHAGGSRAPIRVRYDQAREDFEREYAAAERVRQQLEKPDQFSAQISYDSGVSAALKKVT